MPFFTRRRLRIFGWILAIPVLLFGTIIILAYTQQDRIVQELITKANDDFHGKIVLRDSHISPFANFPYISIDLEDLQLFESKADTADVVFKAADLYIGIDLFTLIAGDFQIKAIKIKDGQLSLVQHLDSSFNLTNALAPTHPIEDTGEEFHLDLKRISVENLAVKKLNESSRELFDVDIASAVSRFKSTDTGYDIGLDTYLTLTMIQGGDTSFVKNKHFDISTDFTFDNSTQKVDFAPSKVALENAVFNMEGSIDLDDDANLHLKFDGSKRDFDLLLAFAPEELAPTLEIYANEGEIYFKASVEGSCINGHTPQLLAEFGCKDGFFSNTTNNKKLDDLQFSGYFSTGADRGLSSMEFALNSFSMRPEAGIFTGSLVVKNFESPDIDLQLDSDFDLDFLAKFFNVEQLQDLRGHVLLKMNFHDIIDLSRPELSIERLNESYFTELHVTNLGFRSPDFHLPIEDIDIKIKMDGHAAEIEHFRFKAGRTDFSLSGSVDDLPAIIHHTDIPVNAKLALKSKMIDLYELTSGDTTNSAPIDEAFKDLDLQLRFKASARAFTESKNLPIGEFLIDNLDVTFKNYPHRLHDFKADVFIEEEDFSIIDFSGIVDESDFHFAGRLTHYDLWFDENPQGDTRIEFDLDSKMIRLEDLFSYGGENFVPEDYRHEELQNLRLHGHAELHFKDSLHSTDIYLDQFTGKMKMHAMKLEKFSGQFHFENEQLTVTQFKGTMGQSNFAADLQVDLKTIDQGATHRNKLKITSTHLNFDELFAWEETTPKAGESIDHDAAFSVFDMPFPNLDVDLKIGKMNYHKYLLTNLDGKLRTTRDHMLYIDDLDLDIAGGHINAQGYFTGQDRTKIYLNPKITFKNLDIDQLLIKFDNFGQDAIVAENLHGIISGVMTGKIHVHADLVPIIDDSEIHIDLEVVKGRLDNYEPMLALAEYFQDKNLNRVAFDTLSNHIDITNGLMSIPNMQINSSLGFIELSGTQDMDLNMDYIIRVPVKLITKAGSQKLFGSKNKSDGEAEDEIQYAEEGKRTRFVNVRMVGNLDDFKISLVGKKKALASEK